MLYRKKTDFQGVLIIWTFVGIKMFEIFLNSSGVSYCYIRYFLILWMYGEIEGENMEAVTDFIFLHSKITADGDCSHEIKRCLLLGRKVVTNLDSIWKAETSLCQQGSVSWSYVFSSSPIRDHKEGWVPKNWCFQIVVLEKTPESPFDRKEIKAVNPRWNQPWIFTGRTDAEAEVPILWSPDAKS